MVRTCKRTMHQVHAVIEREIISILADHFRADAFGDDRSIAGRFSRAQQAVREIFASGEIDRAVKITAHGVSRFANRESSRVLGVPIIDHEAFAPLVSRSVSTSVALIRSVAAEELGRAEEIIKESAARGLRVEEIIRLFTKTFSLSDSRAELIARDQTLKLNADVNQERQAQAGVTSYTWSTSKDSRVREDHQALDGEEFSWLSPPVVDKKTGRREHPGRDFQCRCVAIPVIKDVTDDER